jgi:DNA-binding LytR/AlgR family response regulator
MVMSDKIEDPQLMRDEELEVILANGRRLKFMRRELRGFLTSRHLLVSLVAIVGIAIAVDPYVFPTPVNLFGRAIFWILGVMLYLIVIVTVGLLIAAVSRRLGFGAIYWPLVGIPIVAFATIGAAYLGAFFTDEVETRLDLDAAAFIRNYLLAQAFEFLLLNFVMSDHVTRQRLRRLKSDTVNAQPASLIANGRTIFIDHIQTLEAKQHYVEITTRTGKIVVRSTLKTLLAQIPDTAGLQVHRSFWVNRNVMVQISGNSGKKQVHLKDGRLIPVSRPREAIVDQWFRDHLKP